MTSSLRGSAFDSSEVSAALAPNRLSGPRCIRVLTLALLISPWVFLLSGKATAQSACAQLGVDCSHRGRSTESDDDRQARLEAAAEARAERKAERDAKRAADKKAKEEARQRSETARIEAEARRRQEVEAQKSREIEATLQRQAAIEARQRQTAFNAQKPAVVSSLKDAYDVPQGPTTTDSFGLKPADDAKPAGKPAWDASITDPQVTKIAKRLGSVVPPLPIPKEEVSLTWKDIYLSNDRLMNTTDLVVAGWEMTGVVGGGLAAPYKIIMIAGKTFIAGEDGAYLHLVKREQDYDAALAFLKNPAQSQKFARLVQDIRQNRPVPAGADPAMVRAAQAVTDPKLGNSATSIAWDAMMSREALSAMFRKATVEITTEAVSAKAEDLVKSLTNRKAVFDSVRLEREQARRMMTTETTTPQQREQLTTVMNEANRKLAAMYWVDRTANTGNGMSIGDVTDKLVNTVLGPANDTPEKKQPSPGHVD